VKKLNRLEFVNNLTSEIVSKLELEDLSEDEKITATNQNIELLTNKVISIGINEDTIRLAKKNIESLRKNVKMNLGLSKLLEQLYRNKSSYLFLHTQIISFVAIHIIKNMEWGSPEQEEKLCFSALFHDIYLENDQQAKVHSSNELRQAGFTDEKKNLVERHAQMASELVAKFPRAPLGADQIIRQHHGQLNGVGFSEHHGAVLSPPAMVFVLSEEFTKLLLKQNQENLDKFEIIRELKEKFPTSRFSKMIEKLDTLLV
jgi:HD-GYP domain-containing protein (c-di-GMP phosphodiesterase class II)